MLSESIHSIADLANQCLLAIGMSESKKDPDMMHPCIHHLCLSHSHT